MKHSNLLHSMAFAFIAMLLLGFTSCTEEQEVENMSLPKDAIRFSVVGANGTRSAMDSKNFRKELKQFFVNAFSDNAIHTPYMKDVEFINDGNGNFMYKDKRNIKLWPDYSLNFVAMNAHNILGAKLEMFQQDFIDLGVFRGGEKDIVAAYVPNQNKLTNNREVFLQFHHLLSQIKFYVEDHSTSRLDCKINKIGLKGVYDDAFFSIDRQGKVSTSMTQSGSGYGDYSIDVKNYNPNQEPVLMNNGKDIFVVPLNHISWDPKSGIKIKDINNAIRNRDDTNIYSYVWLECKIKKDGKYIVGNENSYGRTYFPFRVNLKAGKTYNYTIKISDNFYGYTEDTQEPELGSIITDKGNIYKDCEVAYKSGEDPVAMIVYIEPDGKGPSPYKKHGLAISLSTLAKETEDATKGYRENWLSLQEIESWYNYIGNSRISVGKEPDWTNWYIPSWKDLGLIFMASGGREFMWQKNDIMNNEDWSYGELDNMLAATDPTSLDLDPKKRFTFAEPFCYQHSIPYKRSAALYAVRKTESGNIDNALNDIIIYNAAEEKYETIWQDKYYPSYKFNVRLVFRF